MRRGSGGCDVLFAVSFLCVVERRRGLVLGKQRRWPSDACCCVLRELFVCCGGDVCRADDVFFGAARRWHDDRAIHARGCCWFGQRRCDACFGRGKLGVVIAAWLPFGRHMAADFRDCIGCVVVIGGFEFSRELVCGL